MSAAKSTARPAAGGSDDAFSSARSAENDPTAQATKNRNERFWNRDMRASLAEEPVKNAAIESRQAAGGSGASFADRWELPLDQRSSETSNDDAKKRQK